MKNKIKVLVITFSFPTKVNRASSIFLLNQLEYLKKDCDIKVLSPYPYVPNIKFLNSYHKFSTVPIKENMEGIEVFRPRYFMLPRNKITLKFINIILIVETFFSYIKSKKILNYLAKNWKLDIIHVHGFVPDGIIAVKSKKRYKKPLVITFHGEDITKYSKKTLIHSISKYVIKNCDKIISVSKSLKKEVYKTNLTQKPIDVIPSGYNVRRFKILNTSDSRKELNLPNNKIIILFVGHLIERKGVNYLIEALNILNKKNMDFICCLVGVGTLESKLREMVSKQEEV